MSVFVRKSLANLMHEAQESGAHSLKRTLGPFQLPRSAWRRDRRGHFRIGRTGRALRRAGADAVLRSLRIGLRVRGLVLCGIRRHDSAGGQRLHLRLRHARRTLRLDHRLGPDARIRHGREHGLLGMVEPLHRGARHFHIKMPLWLAYDHWTGLRTAENIVARQMAVASNPSPYARDSGIPQQGGRHHGRAIAGTGPPRARPAQRPAFSVWSSDSICPRS